MFKIAIIATLVGAFFALPAVCAAQELGSSRLDQGYRDLYNLRFDAAHQAFGDWQRQHPDDPLGPVSDAAADLFSEFNRLHILELEFFADDSNFTNQQRLAPDAMIRERFEAQLDKAKHLADARLARDPKDANAMFASVLTLGLRGDYVALIEKRNLAGLSYMKDGRALAEKLLAIDPQCYDAYVAVGIENYLLSLKPAPVRWVLRMTGAETDPTVGLNDLRLTAEKGHYLRPYARLLLAVAALRAKDRNTARMILQDLARRFPENTLYTKELARLQ